MDSTALATRLGTEPRILRQFLRSSYCSFKPVGSGSRYKFKVTDLEKLREEYTAWVNRTRKPKRQEGEPRKKVQVFDMSDEQIWAEEGEVLLANINDPKVRARVKWEADNAIAALHEKMRQKGIIPGVPANGR